MPSFFRRRCARHLLVIDQFRGFFAEDSLVL
jgi:hypothetical protein